MSAHKGRLAVIGAGAWGAALAILFARDGWDVRLWMRAPCDGRRLPRLPDHELPPGVTIVRDLPETSDLTLLVVPTQALRGVAARLPGRSTLIACCKGIERDSLCLPLEVLAQTCPGRSSAVLSGPNFAGEIASLLPGAATIACADLDTAQNLARRLSTPSLRLYPSDDPTGVQLAGAAKNVIAIAAGIAMGAGLGENARAALITRGIVEIGRLSDAVGGRSATIAGLSGMGDLVLTCTGRGSRNYSLGLALGRGETLSDILASRSTVAEGVHTAPALLALAARHGVPMPIADATQRLLSGEIDIPRARELLLDRPIVTE